MSLFQLCIDSTVETSQAGCSRASWPQGLSSDPRFVGLNTRRICNLTWRSCPCGSFNLLCACRHCKSLTTSVTFCISPQNSLFLSRPQSNYKPLMFISSIPSYGHWLVSGTSPKWLFHASVFVLALHSSTPGVTTCTTCFFNAPAMKPWFRGVI